MNIDGIKLIERHLRLVPVDNKATPAITTHLRPYFSVARHTGTIKIAKVIAPQLLMSATVEESHSSYMAVMLALIGPHELHKTH